MIQPTELSLNNLVSIGNNTGKVTRIHDNKVQVLYPMKDGFIKMDALRHSYVSCEHLDGIPITPEFLEQSGHTKMEEGLYVYDRIRIRHLPQYGYWYISDNYHEGYLTKVEYVHEYQDAF